MLSIVLFFFKQKTAYEMRISDWSSDVCSSDLFVDNFKLPDAELIAGNLEANRIFSDFEDLNVPTVAAINGIALGGGLEMCLAADYRVMSTEIGRASCRERVCQDV